MSTHKSAITVARGEGIGPEIMEATLCVLQESGARLAIEEIAIGEKVYRAGHATGITPEALASLQRTKVFLKAPITTPQGGGFRSLNVTLRTTFGLYANIRPCIAYAPFVPTKHPGMDLVIIRENEEDLYTGIEYRQSPDVVHALKLISRQGSEKIIRYAFEYARHYGRKKVTCLTKDNILKMSDGLFHQIFHQVGEEYPDIAKEHLIVDIGMAKIADTPERFDVIVLPNLYGDILSDITAQISGSVGLVGTANLGEGGAMFEAIHGSAPALAGKDVANPSALLLAAVLMLVHIGQPESAQRIHNAWLRTLEEGIHTKDIHRQSPLFVGTQAFARAIIKNLGQIPQILKPALYSPSQKHTPLSLPSMTPERLLKGIDLYIYANSSVEALVAPLTSLSLPLTSITNRGTVVWPTKPLSACYVDQWRCRFETQKPLSFTALLALCAQIDALGFEIIHTENLYTFDGHASYT